MLSKDILLIFNPKASKGKGKNKANAIRQAFEERHRHCTLAFTKDAGHARILAEKGISYRYKVIVAAGGDGTVNEVLNGIMHSPHPERAALGIIPTGRGNDFAWAAGIPTDIKQSVSLILNQEPTPIDVGVTRGPDHPDGLYFLNGTGIGFEPMVNFKAMEYRKLNGMPSYIMAFLNILKKDNFPRPYHLEIELDDKEIMLDTQQFSILNGRRMGSAFVLGPEAEIDDGLFDIMYLNSPLETKKEILGAVLSFIRGSHVSDKERFTYTHAKRVRIRASSPDMQIHCDGEVYSRSGQRIEAEILPGALMLIRP